MDQKETKPEETSKDKNEEQFDESTEGFIKETEEYFDEMWQEIKERVKELSKKDLAKQMFVSGALMHKQVLDKMMQESMEKLEKNPEELKKMLENEASGEESIWKKGSFIETLGPEDSSGKMRTFQMKHDEEMNFNCKLCKSKMSAHNNDWHDGMCDSCFDKEHFEEE